MDDGETPPQALATWSKDDLIAEIERLHARLSEVDPDESPESSAPSDETLHFGDVFNQQDVAYVLHNAGIGIAIFDTNERLVYFNKAYANFFPPELKKRLTLGLSFETWHLMMIAAGYFVPAVGTPEEWVKERVRLFRIRAGYQDRQFSDGRWTSVREFPTTDGGTMIVRTDVTDRRHAQEVGVRATDLLKNSLNALPAGFAIYDGQEKLVAHNHEYARIHSGIRHILQPGLSFKDFVHASYESGDMDIPADDKDGWINERIDHFRHPQAPIQRRFTWGDWILIQEAKTDDGHTVVVETDITQMKETERKLDQALRKADAASQAKTDFLSQMTHELRNPLNAIIGFSDILVHKRMGPFDDPRYEQCAATIHEAGERLNNLISDILDVSRIQSGEIELLESRVDLDGTLRACKEMVSEKTGRHGLEISIENTAGDIQIFGDEKRLRQILIQLLWNSVNFTPDGGNVTVRADINLGGGLDITVADTGIGISAAHLAEIMMPFVKSPRLRRSSHGGTGLGLTIAKALAEMHDGTLMIESIEGEGTTVTIRLPASRLHA